MEWTQFVSACNHFLALSEQYGDSWRAEGDPVHPGEFFISLRTLREYNGDEQENKQDAGDGEVEEEECTTCSSSGGATLSCRFDVIFSLSYSVPVMYFKMSKSDGNPLSIQEIWKLVKVSSPDLWSTVSQMDHPVLQLPFYAFHPCQTEKLMETLCSSVPEGNNTRSVLKPHEFLISWLSFMASILQFHFPQQYIVHCSPRQDEQSCQSK